MSAERSNRNPDPPLNPIQVVHIGRDSRWAELHQPDPAESAHRIRRKWQCLACGECGFVELALNAAPMRFASRIGHGCQPESIAFYTPGANQPLAE